MRPGSRGALLTLDLPPLRSYKDNLETLAHVFLEQSASSHGKPAPRLGPAVLARLTAYDFPGKTADLTSGMYWYQGSNHGWDSNHGNTRSQRFAYDLGVARFNGTKWTGKRAPKYYGEVVDGSKNDHYNAWGVPVYAVRAGTIIRGYRLRPDNSAPGVKDSGGGGGNGFWIQHEAGNKHEKN